MEKTVDIQVAPDKAEDLNHIKTLAARQAGEKPGSLRHIRILRRSLDARQKKIRYHLRVRLYMDAEPPAEPCISDTYRDVHEAPEVHIVGAGPAGYFAALTLLECGLKPVIFERGKDVRARRRDLRAIQQESIVNPDSNYCFGEGGAGTYSDGKLYTRAKKRGDIEKTLRILVEHGAKPDILMDAHPHIGSNKLPKIVASLRSTIEHYGGEVHFGARVTDFIIRDRRICAVRLQEGTEVNVRALVLATGHSARDIYTCLHRRGVLLECKPFALGVRIEHPQPLIDRIQYRKSPRGPYLPAASYRLACAIQEHGVFSFCMCPGGLVVPAATAPGEIVVNGMSLSRRDSPFANAGTVVSVGLKDLQGAPGDVFAGLRLQAQVEKSAFHAGDGSQSAPAQRLMDFLNDRQSADLPPSSYIPGLFSYDIRSILPPFITRSLKAGIRVFGKKMHGYLTNEAVMIATESRTSSPVRIPRSQDTKMHPQIEGLFPAGEGGGYAGGIVSAAMDGQNVANAVHAYFQEVLTLKS